MQKISLSLGLGLLAIWGIHNFDVNSDCFQITEAADPLNGAVLIDKCKGRTWALVNDESEGTDYDEDGNVTVTKFKTLVWTRIYRSDGTISLGDVKE